MDALRSLVDAEQIADAVAGAVVIVSPSSQSGPRARMSRFPPSRPRGKRAAASEVSAQDERAGALLLLGDRAKCDGTRYVGRRCGSDRPVSARAVRALRAASVPPSLVVDDGPWGP